LRSASSISDLSNESTRHPAKTGKMLSSVNDAVLAALPGALLDLELLLL